VTQKERVLDALRSNPRGLSHIELNQAAKLPASSKRISELRDDGWDIPDVPIEGENYGRYILRGKKCNIQSEKQDASAVIGNPITDRQTDFAPGITENNVTAKSLFPLKWYGYKCEKGHIDQWWGSDPPKEIPCAGCNYQMKGSLIN
jgi:hypothetical protein